MIPYDELDRALARWKARTQGGAVESDHVSVESAAVVGAVTVVTDGYGSVPQPINGAGVNGLPPPSESTGELDLDDGVVESYEEGNEGNDDN
jgi:hypothetical protein